MKYHSYLSFALIFLCVGCASVEPSFIGSGSGGVERLYEGPPLKEEQVAVIVGKHYGSFLINGQKFKFSNVELLPGDYSLKAAYIKGSFGYSLAWVDLPITVEAGKRYEIKKLRLINVMDYDNPASGFLSGALQGAGIGEKAVFIWIEDMLSGQVIAGYKPPEVGKNQYKADFTKGFDGR